RTSRAAPSVTSMTTTSSPAPTRTRARRDPAPDLARGAMLLAIALANVMIYLYDRPYGLRHHVVTDGALDPLVTGLLTATVDARAYPMFAALYGYGLGADRRDAAGARLVGGGRARLPAAPRARPGAARRAARRPGVLRRHPRLVRAARGAARGCVGALVRPTAARRGGGDPARGRGRGRGRAGHR